LYHATRLRRIKRIAKPRDKEFYYMNIKFYHNTLDKNFKVFNYLFGIEPPERLIQGEY